MMLSLTVLAQNHLYRNCYWYWCWQHVLLLLLLLLVFLVLHLTWSPSDTRSSFHHLHSHSSSLPRIRFGFCCCPVASLWQPLLIDFTGRKHLSIVHPIQWQLQLMQLLPLLPLLVWLISCRLNLANFGVVDWFRDYLCAALRRQLGANNGQPNDN